MRKFVVDVQFNGKHYFGFQRLNGKHTIQGEIETALFKLFNQQIEINGCGRTDAGVSAEHFFFDFSCETKLPTDRIPFKLNRYLPKDIQAQHAIEVNANFNSRHDAISKTYVYSIYVSNHILPLKNQTAFRVDKKPDVEKMRGVCSILCGKHDFSAFRTHTQGEPSSIRTIYDIAIGEHDNDISLTFTGDGFLYNMVRILAGTLLKVGMGQMSKSDVENLLHCNKTRDDNPAITLPPHALILKTVNYSNI